MNKRLILLITLLMLSIGIGILNTYLYFSKVQAIQNSVIALENAKPVQPIVIQQSGRQGLQGIQGATGSGGVQGAAGQIGPTGPAGPAGAGVTPDQIASAVTTYLQANPPAAGAQGLSGIPGINGEQIVLRCYLNQVQWEYSGDFTWQALFNLGGTDSCET